MKKMLITALVSVFFAPFATAEVNVVSWGGAYTESQKLGYGDPFTAKTGIKLNWIDYSGGLSEVRAQSEAGNITYDIVDLYAKILLLVVTRDYLLNLILTKIFQRPQMELQQVKISLLLCQVIVQ